MNNIKTTKRVVFYGMISMALSCATVFAQGIPDPGGDPEPQVLVGALPGDASVDNTGSASYSMPLAVPPGTAGVQPSLGITYGSRGGNGALGIGFTLSGLSSISRMASDRIHDGLIDGVDFDEHDRLSLDGQRLVLVSSGKAYGEDGSEYRTEIESFSKVVLHGGMNSSNSWFEVRTKSGLIHEYGNTADSFVEPCNTNLAVSWVLNRISDTAGNHMDYLYDEDVQNGEHLLGSIEYTGNDAAGLTPFNTVDFVYSNRTDTSFSYMQGARFNSTKRLEAIQFNVESNLVHEYLLEYEYGSFGKSYLASVRQVFANGDEVPATVFDWEDSLSGTNVWVSDAAFTPPAEITDTSGGAQKTGLADLNGDGLIDMMWCTDSETGAYTNSGSGFVEAAGYADFPNSPAISGNPFQFHDFNGDGKLDIVVKTWIQSLVYLNTGSGWTTIHTHNLPWHLSLYWSLNNDDPQKATRFVDADADGRVDFVCGPYMSGDTAPLAYRNTGTEWEDSAFFPQYFFARSISGRVKPVGVRFADLDGDELTDMLFHRTMGTKGADMNTGTNWMITPIAAYEPPYPMHDDDYGELGVQIVDVNGDGLPDFLYHRKKTDGTIEKGAYLNTGIGWATNSTTAFEPPLVLVEDDTDQYDSEGVVFVDLNGDGLVDIAWNNSVESGAWINSGNGWVRDDRYAPLYPLATTTGRDKGSRLADINGDGLLDQIYSCGSNEGAWINQSRVPLLKKITKGWREGGEYSSVTELFYKPLTDKSVYTKGTGAEFPVSDIQGSMQVVSEMSKDNGLGDRYWSMYTYAGARSHRDRGFLGFQIFESYDPQTRLSQVEYLAQDFPLTGVQLKTETRYIRDHENDPGGELLKEVENTYLYDTVDVGHAVSNAPLFYYVAKSTERKWELGNTNDLMSEVTSYNWFDAQDASGAIPNLVQYTNNFPSEIEYGNIAKIVIDYGGGTKQVSTNGYYAVDEGDWILGRLKDSVVTHIQPNSPTIVRTASFAYYATTGLLASETSVPGSGKWLKTDYLYDTFGNITNKTVSGADVVTRTVQSSVYDSKGRFVTESKNALGHTETIVTDPATGQVESRTGPNGLPTSWQYDAMGHPKQETRADGTATTTTYAWETGVSVSVSLEPGGTNTVFAAAYSVTTQSSGTAPSKTYFDRQGRRIRNVFESPSGQAIHQDTGYNGLGQKVAVSNPYFPGDTPGFGFTQYDELGRPQIATAPDGTKTAYGYNGLASSVTNNFGATNGAVESRNQHTTTYKNTKGQLLKVVDNLGYEIEYEYDAAGNLLKTIDEPGNEVVMEYDLRGNKIRQDDPDMGEWAYGYNALGELVSQTNANLQIATMEYDLLGRMTQRTAPEGTAEWFFDNPGEGGKIGALWREELSDSTGTNLVHRRTHAYDDLGRPLLTLQSIDNKWYYTCNTYDEFSRVASNHRFWRPQSVIASGDNLSPAWNSFESINTYNERGAVTQVADGTGHVWWTIDEADFDAKGHLLEYTLGNDVVTSHEYDPDTGFIEEMEISSMTNGVFTYGFQHDRLGNLKQRTLNRTLQTSLSETFGYDGLNRLVGVDDASSFVVYDAIGNIQSKADVGTYQYGANNAGPHAVTSADGVTYTYDNCGNMLGRYEGGTNISSTAWTSFNKVSTLYNGSDGSEFTYDINHSRIVQISFKDGDGTKKLYLGGFEQTEELTGSQYDRANWQWTHTETRVFVSTPSGTIGIHVQDSAENVERKYLHKDHLGSIVAVTGEGSSGSASILSEYSYDSWGKPRNSSDWTAQSAIGNHQSAMDRGFTGHEMLDHVGLVHMNGRIYDSNLGRFLSADPIVQAPGDLQSYNRYSYVRNNPLTLTDPSGYSWWGDHVTKWGRDVRHFFTKYWKPIVITVIAVVVTFLTWGAASGPMVGMLGNVWGAVATGALAGAAGGFAAGFYGTALYGGTISDAFSNAFTGAAWGGVAGAVGGYIKAAAWGALYSALAHGVTGSAISLAQGGSWDSGFLAGFGAGVVSGFMGGANIALKAVAAALVGGTASAMGGGKFASGAVTGAFALLAGEGLKALRQSHYNRNRINEANLEKIGLGDTGLTDEKLINEGFTKSKYRAKVFHDRKHPGYQRWSMKAGEFAGTEMVVDLNGNRIFDPINAASFNYSPKHMSAHFLTDMLPYYPFGNSPNDPSNIFSRLFRTLEGPRRLLFENPATYGQ